MLRKLKWQIEGEPLVARYNWCQGPVPGRGPAVEKHCYKKQRPLSLQHAVRNFAFKNMSAARVITEMEHIHLSSSSTDFNEFT